MLTESAVAARGRPVLGHLLRAPCRAPAGRPSLKSTINVAERYVMGQATDEELKRAQVQAELLAMQAIRDDYRAPSAFAAWAAWKATLFVVVDAEGAATEALSNANGTPVDEVRARHEAMLLQMLRDLEDEEMAEFIDEDEQLDL